jgi:hypothetical protein
MKKRVLTSVKVVADVDKAIRFSRSLDDYAKQAESLAREFNAFVRDHRSMDWVSLSVDREYEDQCEHCHYMWEVDSDGVPMCCDVAIKEHEANISEVQP